MSSDKKYPIRVGAERDLYLENMRASYRKKYDERKRDQLRGALVLIALALALVIACLVWGARADATTDAAAVAVALEHWTRAAPRHQLRVRAYRTEVAEAIAVGAGAHGLPIELVTAMTLRESSGRQDARGRAGELGLLQVHPDTAVRFRCRLGAPGEQVECGCRVLARHLARCGTLRGALAAYGSRSGSCTPPRGGPVERMVNDRMRLAAELRAVMDGGSQ